ncbi:hypothetical protein BD770DRAFT_398566 [Pilaira anomala]|nr:hypothetical protein BD770DRAFT_398566 [Pilaira anomala]
MTYWKSLLLLKPTVKKDPRLMPVWRKRLLLGLVCFIAIIPGFCSTIYVMPTHTHIISILFLDFMIIYTCLSFKCSYQH